MFRSRLAAATATAALAAGAVVGIAPLATAAPAVSACVSDLQSAQTANNAAIAADQANNAAGARIQNVAAATYLAAAIGDCQGQPTVVGANVLTATATNATALVYNILGVTSSALSSEQATASALTQALASAT
ncbi:hypothetical protein ACWEG1_26615 [Streptomyces bauhiniae]|uniref:Secreted protein n=1 Tax=Streptomyces bauhiniae TaxID=2340725 RepID=A0A4Z1DAM2_9ACTN|nr:hypothetical protein [Streptomyces bauhiniae]TGN79463.1 hypothetical protein E5083_07500 [Streptomyces bauhiniae]